MNIFVGNLASDVKEDELKELFSKHGRVSSVKIIRDMFSQTSKGFAFIEMPGKAEAQKALSELNTFELKGKRISVSEARPQRERRGGGGGRRF
jgi:RNA recognition motif-containing protein